MPQRSRSRRAGDRGRELVGREHGAATEPAHGERGDGDVLTLLEQVGAATEPASRRAGRPGSARSLPLDPAAATEPAHGERGDHGPNPLATVPYPFRPQRSPLTESGATPGPRSEKSRSGAPQRSPLTESGATTAATGPAGYRPTGRNGARSRRAGRLRAGGDDRSGPARRRAGARSRRAGRRRPAPRLPRRRGGCRNGARSRRAGRPPSSSRIDDRIGAATEPAHGERGDRQGAMIGCGGTGSRNGARSRRAGRRR